MQIKTTNTVNQIRTVENNDETSMIDEEHKNANRYIFGYK